MSESACLLVLLMVEEGPELPLSEAVGSEASLVPQGCGCQELSCVATRSG